MGSRALNSSRLFLYSGLGLFLIALSTLPTTVRVPVGANFNTYSIGWLIAPVIGAWGLASIALGITESSLSRRNVLLCLLPVFALILVGLGFASWMVMNYGENMFWRTYFGFFLFPCLIAGTVSFFYFTKKEKLAQTFQNLQVRVYVLVALVAVPLLYTAAFLTLFTLLS